MNLSRSPRFRGPILPAIFLIALGVFFFLTENHIIHANDLWRLWPLLLVIAGITRLSHGTPEGRISGVVLLVLAIVFQASGLGYLPLRPSMLWPLVLIGAGVILLGKSIYGCGRQGNAISSRAPENFAIFGGGEVGASGNDVEGTAITALLGGYNLDLRKAAMKGSEAVIEATAIFGGIEIHVPVTWNVVVQATPVFGGYSDETLHPEATPGAQQLFVRGSAIFGGVAVKN